MWEFSMVVCSSALNQFVTLCWFFKVSAIKIVVLISLDFHCSHAGLLRGLSASASYYRWGSDPSPLRSASVFLKECRGSGSFCDAWRRNRANLEARSLGWGSSSRYWPVQALPASFLWVKVGYWLYLAALPSDFHVSLSLEQLSKTHFQICFVLMAGFPLSGLLPWFDGTYNWEGAAVSLKHTPPSHFFQWISQG